MDAAARDAIDVPFDESPQAPVKDLDRPPLPDYVRERMSKGWTLNEADRLVQRVYEGFFTVRNPHDKQRVLEVWVKDDQAAGYARRVMYVLDDQDRPCGLDQRHVTILEAAQFKYRNGGYTAREVASRIKAALRKAQRLAREAEREAEAVDAAEFVSQVSDKPALSRIGATRVSFALPGQAPTHGLRTPAGLILPN